MAALASPMAAAAQTSTAPIGVTAKVQSAVTLSGMVPLDFGAGIVPGTPATITAANGGRIMASYNVNTQLSLPNTVTLTRAGGGSVLVTLSCAQAATGTAPAPTPFATDCATGYGAVLSLILLAAYPVISWLTGAIFIRRDSRKYRDTWYSSE